MKNIKAAALPVIASLFLFCSGSLLYAEPEYATRGTIELSGSISMSYTEEVDSRKFSLSTGPGIHYFPVDSFHIGVKPLWDYDLVYSRDVKDYNTGANFTPVVQAGYVIGISRNLFFDIAPEIGYSFVYPYSSEGDVNYRYMHYGLLTGLKVQSGSALINVFIQQTIRDHISDDGPDGYYRVMLGLGFSVFF